MANDQPMYDQSLRCYVPKTDQHPSPRKGICRHCGTRLRLFQRISLADFCSSEHAKEYAEIHRQNRSQQICSLLDWASRPNTPPLHGRVVLPKSMIARPDAKPRLWSGSGKWERRLVLPLAQMDAPEPRRLMAAFGPEHVVTPPHLQSPSPTH